MDPNLRKVLSQAVRAEILEWIGKRPSSARDIAAATGEPLSKVTYHTSVLYEASCIRPVDAAAAARDPAERVYELASLEEGTRLPLSDSTRARALSSVLRRIVERGRAALEAGTLQEHASRLSCDSVLLDEQGLREAQTILDEAAERIAATKSATAKRLAGSGSAGIEATIAFAAFESPREEKPSQR